MQDAATLGHQGREELAEPPLILLEYSTELQIYKNSTFDNFTYV